MSALKSAIAHARTLLDRNPTTLAVFAYDDEHGVEAAVHCVERKEALLIARALAHTAAYLIASALDLPEDIEHVRVERPEQIH